MKLEIKNQEDNHLLNRTEVEFEISHENTATPKRADTLELLATKTKRDKKLIIIKHIKTIYGKNMSKGLAYIYTDENALKAEPKYSLERGKKKPKEKSESKESKPKEEEKPAEEAPAEEKKEEVKAEAPE